MSVISENKALLWSGKALDRNIKRHGSSLVNDFWQLSITSLDTGVTKEGFAWDRLEYGAAAPAGRWKSAGDVIEDRLVIFGGDDGNKFLNDVWSLPLIENASLATSTSSTDGTKRPGWGRATIDPESEMPAGRRGHVMIAAHKGNVMVMQGGRKKHHVCLQDTWLLLPKDGATGPDAWAGPLEWKEAAPLPGPCRWGHAAAIVSDPLGGNDLVAIFGGRQVSDDGKGYDYHSDLWFFNPSVAVPVEGQNAPVAWTLHTPKDDVVPEARDHHAMAFEKSTGSIYVFGGRAHADMNHAALNDLWRYSVALNEWTCIQPHGTLPRTRYLHSMVALHNNLVAFGGEHIKKHQPESGDKKGDSKLNDLWMYSPELNRWSQVSSDGCMAGETGLIYHTSVEGMMTLLLVMSALFSAGLIFCSHRHQKGSGTLCSHWFPARTTREGGGNVKIQMTMMPPRTGYERIA